MATTSAQEPTSTTISEVKSHSSFFYYNPYEKRTVKVPLTNFEAFVSLLKCVIGTGILAMPLAFRYSGILVGALLSLLLILLLTYSIHLLISGMTECCRRKQVPQVSMPEAVQIACALGPSCVHCCANLAGLLTSCVLVVGQFGLCTVYVVFVAKNFKEIGDFYWQEVNERFYVTSVCVMMLPLFMIRKLKFLVPLNLISNVLLYMGFLCIMYYLVRGLPDIGNRALSQPPFDWIMFFGIAAFSLTAVGSMLVVEANMKHPQQYLGMCGVLNLAVIFILLSNVGFGIMGYWRYGANIKASISLNLPQNEFLSQFIKIFIASGIFLSYPLNGFVAITVVFGDYVAESTQKKYHHALEYLMRIVFLVCTGLVAVCVPNLAALTAFEGAFSLSNLNLFCPALINMFLNYDVGYGKWHWKLFRDFLLMVVAIIFGVIGCSVAIRELLTDFKTTLQSLHI